jgi:hypothetical protein
LIELQHGGFAENLGEHQTLCRAIFKHAGGLVRCVKHCLDNMFEAELVSRVFDLMHYPG